MSTSAFAAMSAQPASNGNLNGKQTYHTVTALKRWRCNSEDKDLPPASDIKAIHVYDFDNTLFASPLPNKNIWTGPTIAQLIAPDVFVNGGWWHDSNILATTGEGVEKEEPRAWDGWWNEQIVTLVELTMQQKDALSILLTGRSESGFADLIKRIAKSKKLEFDMVCLKPAVGPASQKFKSTMEFKQTLLKDVVYTYKNAEEIRIYEDRVKHTKAFRDFFFNFNKDLMDNKHPTSRKPLLAEVIQVAENATQLNPVSEVAGIQKMINSHNTRVKAGDVPPGTPPFQIKKTVFYTGYMIPPAMHDKLISLIQLPPGMPETDLRYLANSILITPKPCPKSILDRVGGIGNKVLFKVIGVACYENKLWAAKVEPVPPETQIYSENPTPTIVLATRHGGKPADAIRILNWFPVSNEQSYVFETTVEEKKLLRIEEEQPNENEYESYFPNKSMAKRGREDEDMNGTHRNTQRPRPNPPSHNRGGDRYRGRGVRNFSSNSRGRGGGGGHNRRDPPRGGRSRGGPSQYRSLDDVGGNYGRANHGDDPNAYY